MTRKKTKPPTRKQRAKVAVIVGKRVTGHWIGGPGQPLVPITPEPPTGRLVGSSIASTFKPLTPWAEPAFFRNLNKFGAAWRETRELDTLVAALQKLADRGKGDGDFEQDCADALSGLEPRK